MAVDNWKPKDRIAKLMRKLIDEIKHHAHTSSEFSAAEAAVMEELPYFILLFLSIDKRFNPNPVHYKDETLTAFELAKTQGVLSEPCARAAKIIELASEMDLIQMLDDIIEELHENKDSILKEIKRAKKRNHIPGRPSSDSRNPTPPTVTRIARKGK